MFGEVLKKIRTEHGDSLRKLAEKTDINFTKINKIELGEIAIAEDTLTKFIEVYPLQRNELIEAFIKARLPEYIFRYLESKKTFKEVDDKCQLIYDVIFQELNPEEQKELLNNVYEKLIYFSVQKNKYKEKKEKLEEIKKAIDEL